ncbi:MAG TPA: ACP S-malonyltransferase [Gammaproteobacteria bacterium]|jgi:[acyl-carrier-protein] S-malonyltransferase|nr:ACP S-malonyltransferase [Gammaproteobacteria bacterium]
MNNHQFAFVFPGQGSQSVGMLADAAARFPQISAVFSEASDALGYDLQQLAFHGPAEDLNQTVHTQPALLAASYAVWQILSEQKSLQPAVLAGHSLGEYTALVCANALNFREAVKLVAARGQFMQDAVSAGAGAMAAIIGMDDAAVTALCNDVRGENEVLSPANYNSIGQIVIAGHADAVNRAVALAKERGARMAVLIPVSVPSHCELMRPAAERLADMLRSIDIRHPVIPVICNADVKIYENADEIRAGLTRQLYMPVRWVETIQSFIKMNVNNIIECGPGKVLTGLNKRIDKSLQLQSASDLANIESILNSANERNAT